MNDGQCPVHEAENVAWLELSTESVFSVSLFAFQVIPKFTALSRLIKLP